MTKQPRSFSYMLFCFEPTCNGGNRSDTNDSQFAAEPSSMTAVKHGHTRSRWRNSTIKWTWMENATKLRRFTSLNELTNTSHKRWGRNKCIFFFSSYFLPPGVTCLLPLPDKDSRQEKLCCTTELQDTKEETDLSLYADDYLQFLTGT